MTQPARTAAHAARDAVVFKALANPVRLQIVWLVAASPAGQISAGQIVAGFDLSQPTISHHLRVLREAGVLTAAKRSTFVYYRFAPRLHQSVTSLLPDVAAAAPPGEQDPAQPTRGADAPLSAGARLTDGTGGTGTGAGVKGGKDKRRKTRGDRANDKKSTKGKKSKKSKHK